MQAPHPNPHPHPTPASASATGWAASAPGPHAPPKNPSRVAPKPLPTSLPCATVSAKLDSGCSFRFQYARRAFACGTLLLPFVLLLLLSLLLSAICCLWSYCSWPCLLVALNSRLIPLLLPHTPHNRLINVQKWKHILHSNTLATLHTLPPPFPPSALPCWACYALGRREGVRVQGGKGQHKQRVRIVSATKLALPRYDRHH